MNIKSIARKIPFLVIIAAFAWFFFKGGNITVDDLLNYTPENLYLAFCFLMGFFALKSLSIIFPSAVLFVISSRIYSIPVALLVNSLGLMVCFALMYCIGCFTADKKMEQMLEKYKVLKKIDQLQGKSPLFISYIVRVISVFPMDIVSILFGSMRMHFGKFILGSYLGCAPMMIGITLMGTSITEVRSPLFILSCAATLAIILISFAAYYFIIVKKEKRHRQ